MYIISHHYLLEASAPPYKACKLFIKSLVKGPQKNEPHAEACTPNFSHSASITKDILGRGDSTLAGGASAIAGGFGTLGICSFSGLMHVLVRTHCIKALPIICNVLNHS